MKLTRPQQLIYNAQLLTSKSFSICGSILFNGVANIELLQRALNHILKVNDVLRMKICNANDPDAVYQYIADYSPCEWGVECFKTIDDLRIYALSLSYKEMPLSGNLMDAIIVVLPNQYGILMKLHHIISDAWTLSLVGTLISEKDFEAMSYIEYIDQEEEYVTGSKHTSDELYWKSKISSHGEPILLHEDIGLYDTKRKYFSIDKDKTAKIKSYADDNNTSLFSVFMMAYAIFFSRIKNNIEKFYIGTTILNRSGREKRSMGMFANAVPVPIDLKNDETFEENLSRLNDAIFSVIRRQKYNYGDILKNVTNNEKLYDVILNYQNAQVDSAIEFESEWFPCNIQSESLQIHIDDRDNTGDLSITYDYQTKKFDEKDISRMHGHILNILFDAISSQDSTCRLEEEQ